MNNKFLLAASFTLLFCLNSCKSVGSGTKAIYTDASPSGDETWTRARLAPLNRYASDLLNEYEVKRNEAGNIISKTGKKEPLQKELEASFATRGLDASQVLPLNKKGSDGIRGNYNLYLAEDSGHCFAEGGLVDRDLYWDQHRDQVKAQIENVARFIKEFHLGIEGNVDQPFVFNDIEICTRKSTGHSMRWIPGGKLEIGTPYWLTFGGDYYPLSSSDLMDIWSKGEMFVGDDKVFAALKTLWPVINPMSDYKRDKVKKIKKWAASLSGRITQGLSGGQPSAQTIKSLILANVDPSRSNFPVDKVIARITEENLGKVFLEKWRSFSNNKENQEAIIGANVAAASEKVNVKNHSEGWLFGFANYKRIAVEGSVASGEFKQYVKVDNPREVDIDLRCTGAITICLIDDVTVLLQFVKM